MSGKVMAVDLGQARIGVAISDGLRLCANPLTVFRSRGVEADVETLVRFAEENEAEEFVVGLPLNMDDTESPSSRSARAFAEKLREASGRPVTLWDERLSTVSAQEILKKGTVRRGRKKQTVDKVAATLILQDYLDTPK